MRLLLNSATTRVVTLLMLLQIGVYHAYPKNEVVALGKPLKQVPLSVGSWIMTEESELDSEVQALLKADDTLNRVYVNPQTHSAGSLYIAFFKTQKTGVSPHSPKVCLPGNGWTPSQNSELAIPVANWPEPITVNRYVVSRNEYKSVVLYWYQTHNRVIASEYAAKLYTIADSLRYRRSDTSLVRFVLPVTQNEKTEDTEKRAVEMVQAFFPVLKDYLPQ